MDFNQVVELVKAQNINPSAKTRLATLFGISSNKKENGIEIQETEQEDLVLKVWMLRRMRKSSLETWHYMISFGGA
jgi:hypothetical protein